MRKPRAGGYQARARRIGETQVKPSVMGRCSGALIILTLVGAVAHAGSKQDIADCPDWWRSDAIDVCTRALTVEQGDRWGTRRDVCLSRTRLRTGGPSC